MRPRIYYKQDMLTEALTLAKQVGYQNITRDSLAARIGCSPALISQQFGTMVKLRRAIMSAAVDRSDLKVLAQGLAARDPKAMAASEKLRRAAVEELMI